MKVLVTGAEGMLARALIPELQAAGMAVRGLPRAMLDVTDRAAVRVAIEDYWPEIVVQCAAFTGVDAAEDEENAAFAVNAEAAGFAAGGCQSLGALFVYPSTDYVFSGHDSRAYRPDDEVAPLGAYGRSKAAGEAAARASDRHLIVRTSWLYGAGGRNFVDTIARLAAERNRVEVVDDQVGLPTWTESLSSVIVRLLKVGAVGTFHAADAGPGISWYELAKKVVELRGLDTEIEPISTRQFGARAPRPSYSVLDCTQTERILGEALPSRERSLARYLLH